MFICPKRVPAFSLSKEGMCLKHMERWMESPCDWHLEPARCFRMKSKRLSAALSLGPPFQALSVLLLTPCVPSCWRLLTRLAADAPGPPLGSLAGEVSPPSCLLPASCLVRGLLPALPLLPSGRLGLSLLVPTAAQVSCSHPGSCQPRSCRERLPLGREP